MPSILVRVAISLSLLTGMLAASAQAAGDPDWRRFRGPNGSGVSSARNVPTEFGPEKNLLWRLAMPQGHSSPVLHGDRIYVTGFRGDALVTIAVDRLRGRVLWERAAPQVRTKVVDKRNNPASPSPAVEADGVYVFFPDYGLVAYDAGGSELWKMPLGPFNNIYGMGASPVIVGDLVVLVCDQSVGSFIIGVDKRSGRQRWKTDRPEARSGHSTPILWRGADGKDQILVPGSFLLTSYDAATGRKLWWVGGLSFEMKSTPVIGGDTIYVNGYGAPVNDPGNKVTVPSADEVWKTADADRNGLISKSEFPKFTPAFWFDVADLDTSGALTRDEWAYYRAALDSENGLLAIRLGGAGDMTDSAIRWKYQRSVPQLPSPLLYAGVLYMVNDNGIVTTLEPETGRVIKQGRLTGAPGAVFASPVAADGNIYFTTEAGAVVVVAPGGDLTVKQVNDLGEDTYATPAFADGRVYVRTTAALYAFGEADSPAFQVDPTWPRPMPNDWIFGAITGVFVDATDHVWVTHLPETLTEEETAAVQKPPIATCCVPAPTVIEFDAQGNIVQAWGDPSQDISVYPRNPHGIFVDHNNFVWIGTYMHHRVMKFTRDGKLVMTIGTYDKTGGSNDTSLLGGPAGIWVDPRTNEAFIADGYRNRRVVVFDGATGKYLRHWGAYGKPPDDTQKPANNPDGPPNEQFSTVHGITGSNDGFIYVADRRGNRIQVFDQKGTFIREKMIAPRTLASGSAFVPVLSNDRAQTWLYLADGTNHKIWILRRSDLEIVGEFGRGGRQVGQMLRPHGMSVDSKGNLYVGEASTGRRVQKFTGTPAAAK